MQSGGQSRASKGVGGGGSELECGGGGDSLERGPRTAEQVQAAKQLSRLLRNQRATLKRNRQQRMMQIEEALNTVGYWKGNLLDVGPDFDVRRWQEIVGNIAPERWEGLFQVLYSSREDDSMRQFAYIGGEGCSAEELEALNLLQALHDSLFCVTEIDGGDAEGGANEGETERMGSTAAASGKRRKRPVTAWGRRKKTARESPEPKTAPEWTRTFKFKRKVRPCNVPSRNRRCTVVSALRSQPHCSRQDDHVDWRYFRMFGRLAVLSFFIPCTHPCRLHVWDGSHRIIERLYDYMETTPRDGDRAWDEGYPGFGNDLDRVIGQSTRRVSDVRVGLGEFLIFLGHLTHAGSAWGAYEPTPNVRLHAYFLPSEMPFPPQVKTIIPPPFMRRVFVWNEV